MYYLLVIGFLFYICAWCRPEQRKSVYVVSMFLLWIVIAFRGLRVSGTDGEIYQAWFKSAVPKLRDFEFNFLTFQKYIQPQWGFAWLFTLLASIAKSIADSYACFQIIYATVTFALLYCIVEDLELTGRQKALFMFVYLMQQMTWFFCNLLRQNLANLLIWYALEHDFKKYAAAKKSVLFLLAILTHTSAIICIAFVIALHFMPKFSLRTLIRVAIPVGIIIYFGGSFFIPVILRFMATHIDTRYAMYIGTIETSNVINFLLRLVIMCFFYLMYDRVSAPKKERMMHMSILCYLVGSINLSLAVRLLEYLAIGNYYGLAVVLPATKGKNRKVMAGIYLIGSVTIFVRYLYVNAPWLVNFSFL